MSRKYAIVTEFLLADKASKTLETMGIKSKFLQKSLGTGLATAERRLNSIGVAAGKAALGIAGMGMTALAGGIAKATGAYIAFDDTLTAAGAKMSASGGLNASMEELKKTALDVAAATRFTANDMAGAIDKMAMAGMTASDVIATLPGMAKLATAAGLDATSAIDMATDAMGAFNMAKDSLGQPLKGDALAGSLERISDVVAKVTNSANIDMNMWFESVKNGAATFTQFGGDIEEFSALVGKLGDAGVKGGEAGTAIKNITLGLTGAASTARKALASMGINAFDRSTGKMRSVIDIIGDLESKFAGMGDAEKAEKLKNIFGKENMGSFLILMNEGSKSLRNFTRDMKNAAGASQQMADTMNASLKGRIELLKSAVSNLGINFVSSFDSEGTRNVISALTEAVGYFQSNVLPKIAAVVTQIFPTIQRGIKQVVGELPKLFDAFGTAFTVMKPLIAVISFFVGRLWKLRTPLAIVLGLWGSYQLLMMALVGPIKAVTFAIEAKNIAMGIMHGIQIARNAAIWRTVVAVQAENAATLGAAIGMKLYAVGAKTVTVAQWLWNTAIMACPIAWIVGLLVVLVGIIVVLANKWQSVTAAVDGFFERMRNMEGIGGFILKSLVRPFELVWNLARGLFDTLNAFKQGGFLAGIKMLGLSLLQFVAAPIQAILDSLSFIPGIGKKAEAMRNWFSEQRAGILNPNDATGGADFDNADAAEVRALVAGSGPVNSRTVTESYSEHVSRLDVSLADGLDGKWVGAVAPNVTLDTGKRAAGF